MEKFNRKENKALVTDSQGRNLTIALFKETNDGRTTIQPIWSLKDWKEVYMEMKDPTEYEPAIYLIGDWLHWKQIADKSAASIFIKEWREELKVALRSEGIAQLRKQAKGDKGTTAAKWLAENGFSPKEPRAKKMEDDSLDELIRDGAKRLEIV
jgi:hypothetical protein